MRFNYTPAMLDSLNSATKYPSIETYHTLGDKGRLSEPAVDFGDDHVFITEKVDGTNVRLIFDCSGDLFIGSREELLTHSDDVVRNPALGIVEALLPVLNDTWLRPEVKVPEHLFVIYVELFGHRQTPAWKQYGDGSTAMWRMFDACTVPEDVLEWPKDRVAGWRDRGGQAFLNEFQLKQLSVATGISLTPRAKAPSAQLGWLGTDLPKGIAEMQEFMTIELGPHTRMVNSAGVLGRAEGYVIRNTDRTRIAKARFEDYERTLRSVKQQRHEPAST